MPSRSVARRIWLLFAGLMTGLFGFALGLWFYIEAARVDEIRTGIADRLDIARERIDRVKVTGRDSIRFRVRDVVLRSETGDTILATSEVTLTLDASTLSGTGPIEFHDVVLHEPSVQVVQTPAGDWDYLLAFGIEVGGQPVSAAAAGAEERPLLFHNVRVENARFAVAIPGAPVSDDESSMAMNLPFTTIGGVPYQRYELTGVDATFSLVRVGGPDGWRIEIASLSGDLARPALRIADVRGWAEQEGEDGARFDLETVRVGESVFAAEGLVRFPDEGMLFDVDLSAAPLRMADLEPLFPGLEGDGAATFALSIESLSTDRVVIGVSGLDFEGYDSRVFGDIRFAVGGAVPFTVLGGDLVLAPLQFAALRRMGILGDDFPLDGQITGRVGGAGAEPGRLAVDLRAALFPVDGLTMAPSVLYAAGAVTIGDGVDALQLDGLDVGMQPLHLGMLRGFLPDSIANADWLRGTLEGSVSLAGIPTDMTFSDGIVVYEVDDVPPSQFTNLEGSLVLDPELRYEVTTVGAPLSLAALTALFPGLPFRSANLTGPIEIAGDPTGISISADLDGAAGGIEFTGSTDFGEPLAFDFEGTLRAFEAGIVINADLPVEGPVSGSFGVSGDTERFAFDLDLEQGGGRATLSGTVALAADPPIFDVSGQVTDFRIGILTGDPRLFPDPMTGALSLSGGGGMPYAFDVNLIGDVGRLALEGFYEPSDVPEYEIRGDVAALDLSRLPLSPRLPSSSIDARLDFAGRGTRLETLGGTFSFDATNSTVAGIDFDDAIGRVRVTAGIAVVDTLLLRFEESRLTANGSWGLVMPAVEPLGYTFESPDLSALDRFLGPLDFGPPRLGGSVTARGTVGGSVEYPTIETALVGADVSYLEFGAESLRLNLSLRKTASVGWEGRGVVESEGLKVAVLDSIQMLRMTLDGTQDSFAFGVVARRDADAELAAAGTLVLDQTDPIEIGLEATNIRVQDRTWELQGASRIRVTDAEGVIVENLVLERAGPEPGTFAMNGTIPRTGDMDFRVSLLAIDLSDLRRLTDRAPDVGGTFDLDATFLGPVAGPDVSIGARIEDFSYGEVVADEIAFDGLLSGERLVGSSEVTREGLDLFRAELEIPMRLSLENLSPSFELPRDAPISIVALADSLPLDLVTSLLPGVSDGEGIIRAEVDVRGTLDSPVLAGAARLSGGAISIDSLNVRYSGINAEVTLAQNRILIDSLSIRSGGTLRAGGSIDFLAGAPASIALTVRMNGFRLVDDPDGSEVNASAELALDGPVSAPVLTGWVELFDSTIRVPDMDDGGVDLRLAYADVGQIAPGVSDVEPPNAPLFANILVDGAQLRLLESVWLESPEIRVQITGDLVLYRSGEDLRVFGALDVVRGTYTLAVSGIVREFDVTGGRVQFFGTGDLNPSLDVTAAYRVRGTSAGRTGDLNVSVNVGGTLLSPTVSLGSDAPIALSESDLVSYLLFGQPTFAIEGRFAEQFVVQEFFGSVVANELQRPLQSAGLCDWVRVRPGGTENILTGAAVECGWEISSELFLTAQTGLGFLGGDPNEWGVALEWQIDQQWSLETAYGDSHPSALTRFFDAALRRQLSTNLRRQWEYGRSSSASGIDLIPEEPGATLPVVPDAVPIAPDTVVAPP